jgi:hypothetical protein
MCPHREWTNDWETQEEIGEAPEDKRYTKSIHDRRPGNISQEQWEIRDNKSTGTAEER